MECDNCGARFDAAETPGALVFVPIDVMPGIGGSFQKEHLCPNCWCDEDTTLHTWIKTKDTIVVSPPDENGKVEVYGVGF